MLNNVFNTYWRNERKAIKNGESKEVIFYKNREPGKNIYYT